MGQINRSLDQDTPTPDGTLIGVSRVAMIRMVVRAAFNSHYVTFYVTFSPLVHTTPRFLTHPPHTDFLGYLPWLSTLVIYPQV
jgi:hypothetical protein